MRHAVFDKRLALRIDIDFVAGLDRAVPFFLDALERSGMRATFFVVAGRNRRGSLLRRLGTPGYLRRLWRLGPAGIVRVLGLAQGGDFLETASRRRVVARIEESGHEVALHGFDHAWWADHVWSAGTARIAEEIDSAFRAMRQVLPRDRLAWGSPNWRTTPDVLQMLHQRGVPYFAECWGTRPFRTAGPTGETLPPVHLPLTMPSLETRYTARRRDTRRAIGPLLDERPPDRYDAIGVHDYFEGLMVPSLFRDLLEQLSRRGWQGVALREIASAIEAAALPLPVDTLVRGPLPGFVGLVSWQAGPVG